MNAPGSGPVDLTGGGRRNEGTTQDGPAGTEPRQQPRPPRALRRRPLRYVAVAAIAAVVASAVSLSVARITGWGRETIVYRSGPGPGIINTHPTAIPAILARVLPSVVSISATTTLTSPYFGPSGGSTQATASGTGIVVTGTGEVITNDHVVSGATSITVTLNGSTAVHPARLIGASAAADLALLRIQDTSNLTPATLGDSSAMVVGDDVIAVGYALGLAGGPTVTNGIISATGRSVTTQTARGRTETLTGMFQTDAAISSGNSGGPLVNSAAQVIGINTLVATSSRSATAQNIGFAIPARTVTALLPQLRSSP